MTTVITMGLAFGSYAARVNDRRTLTHSWKLDDGEWVPLCRRVSRDAYCLNDAPLDDAAAPTCETCRRRDPRFHASEAASHAV